MPRSKKKTKPEEEVEKAEKQEGKETEKSGAEAKNENPAAGATATHGVPIQPFFSYPFPPYGPPGMPMPGVPPMVPPPGVEQPNASAGGYTDRSTMPDPPPDTRRNRGGVTEPFPDRLHRMLEASEREGLADVVSFFIHGRAFAIHKPKRFAEEVMPRFFRQTKLTSFQRQLNLYGFKRISQGPDNSGYYHEYFLKGRPGLCVNMKRKKIKGDDKFKRDPDTEPNFYLMRPISIPPPIAPAQSAPGSAPPAGFMMPFPPPYGFPQPPPGASPSQPGSPPGQFAYPPPPYWYWGVPPPAGQQPTGLTPAKAEGEQGDGGDDDKQGDEANDK